MKTAPITRRAFALLQVMIIVGVATVLSFAVLSETSLRAQTGKNSSLAVQADALAESGVNLAMYYLLNPWNAPMLQNGYWPGGTDISLGATVTGTVDVTVVKDLGQLNQYVITSSGKTGGATGSGVTHKATVRVQIVPGLTINRSVSAVKDLNIASGATTITGNVASNQKLTLAAGSRINGTAYANTFANFGVISSMQPIASTDAAAAPKAADIQQFAAYAYSDGRVYSRSAIPFNAVGSGVMDNLGPTGANPAGIYCRTGDLTVNNNFKLTNGTLIVTGNLILNGTSIDITAQDGYPALIVLGEFRTRSGKSIKVTGTTYVATTIKPESGFCVGTSLTFNGAVLFGDNGNINTGTGTVAIDISKANAGQLRLPDLDTSKPRSVTVLSWN